MTGFFPSILPVGPRSTVMQRIVAPARPHILSTTLRSERGITNDEVCHAKVVTKVEGLTVPHKWLCLGEDPTIDQQQRSG